MTVWIIRGSYLKTRNFRQKDPFESNLKLFKKYFQRFLNYKLICLRVGTMSKKQQQKAKGVKLV